ncbi:MAG: DnaD domain protein [Oscillospiraceae bacterium]|nr:DnaD domain protein [Oscillospiraceae bacterium]
MDYQVNFGCWGNVFAVPSAVVDHFLRIASDTQIKVLLYVLKNQNVSGAKIAEFLRITEEETDDAIQFWVQANILQMQDSKSEVQCFAFAPPQTTETPAKTETKPEKSKVQRGSKEIKLDPSEIAHTLETSQELKDLFLCVESLFGRMLNHMEQRSLIWIHNYLGMRSEVLLTLLGYCVSIDKVSMSYAESIAISWTELEILTLEQAESEIRRLTTEHSYLSEIRRMFEMQHSPTSQQKKYIESWRQKGYSMELIRYAYELTIESIEKLNFKYINTILEKWETQGITSAEQAQKQRNSAASSTSNAPQSDTQLDEYLQVVNRFREDVKNE